MDKQQLVDEWRRALGAALAEARKAAELTQEQLAARLSIGRRTMSDLETGKGKNLETLLRAFVACEADFGVAAAKARLQVKSATKRAERLGWVTGLVWDGDRKEVLFELTIPK